MVTSLRGRPDSPDETQKTNRSCRIYNPELCAIKLAPDVPVAHRSKHDDQAIPPGRGVSWVNYARVHANSVLSPNTVRWNREKG